ncbi:MAG: nucleotide exchange factor GrpE [Mycobacteriaceae bacterium]|nr:nucleotide exchange factor GrpE [Mycobacteriaceae bacterium]
MTRPTDEAHEPVTVTDKRRIDPETGEVREASAGAAPGGAAPRATPSDDAAELKATLQRVKAEYDNYRKRSVRQEQAAADRARAAVITQLLPVLDDLDRARSHGDLESGPLRSVADKLTSALEGLGVSAFGDEGDEFDPERHEAVQHEGDGTKPVIGSVLRRGYQIGDRVIRHALVGVVDTVDDGPPEQAPDTSDNGAAEPDNAAESESPAG